MDGGARVGDVMTNGPGNINDQLARRDESNVICNAEDDLFLRQIIGIEINQYYCEVNFIFLIIFS